MAKAVFSARTPQELQRLSEEQGIRTTLQLTAHERSNSASRWTFRHLIAFRLLTNPERKYLETFGSTHSKECPVCNSADDCSQQVDYEMTRAFTRESCPLDLLTSTESDLMRLENGSFWVALARASRPDVFNEGKMYPQRERRDMERADYMNSTTAIVGSSSPTRPSSSEFEVGMEDIDEDDHDARRSKPEEVTVQLVTSFLQHSLYFCLLQRSDETEVRVRVERRRAEMYVNGIDQAVAEDDGGICRMERQALGWLLVHPYLALLEAKRAFKHVHIDNATGEIKPIVSNETLAQCLGEAVITWKANRQLVGQELDFLHSSYATFHC